MKIKEALILLFAGAALFFAFSRWGPTRPRPPQDTPPEHLTYAWQAAHCPPEGLANLQEIALPGGRIADVEIQDVLGYRLYIPRRWTTATRYSQAPSPDGMASFSGGSGTFKPWLGPGSDNPCRGVAFLSVAGKRQNEPRYRLELAYPRFTTQSADGSVQLQSGEVRSVHQVLHLFFLAPGEVDLYARPLESLPAQSDSDQGEALADGWRVLKRVLPGERTSTRIAFDARARDAHQPIAGAVEVYGGWVLIFPIDDHVMARIWVGRDVQADRWRYYGDRARAALDWLRTKPAQRGAPSTTL
jgi:hypothetical protein